MTTPDTTDTDSEIAKGNRPVDTEFIRLSDTKGLVVKLWGIKKSKFEGGYPMPAYVELEEVTYPKDGSQPKYGPSVRLPAYTQTFAVTRYIEEMLMKGRRLNRALKHK